MTCQQHGDHHDGCTDCETDREFADEVRKNECARIVNFLRKQNGYDGSCVECVLGLADIIERGECAEWTGE